MGHKKRATSSHRKIELPAAKAAEKAVDSVEMKQECERALNALRRGNHNKALRLMKEASVKYENSALFHRVAGTISVKVAGIIDDPNVKQRHLKNAVESAKTAKNLSPNSVEYSHFYANLLFEVSGDAREYEEVISECERALAVDNPNDPAIDELSGVEKDETVSFSAEAKEARVSQVQSELKGLIQKANIASISSWMKNLGGGNGEEKFRLIPIRQRAVEDPVEVRYLSGNGNVRRPNEIKKATKTADERRKEIEVRVAAARLLQQKSEQAGEEGKEGGSGGGVGGSLVLSNGSGTASGSGSITPKVGERGRRNWSSRRNASISERKNQVRSFWNLMSSEKKRGLLSIRVSDLRAHFDGLPNKDGLKAGEVFSEALAFGEMHQTWKFWACCRCGERFADANAHIQHVIVEHLGNLSPKLRSVLPQSVDSDWEEMLISCSWEPLDLTASVRMLEDQSKPEELSELSGKETPKEQYEDTWNDSVCSEETRESNQEKKSLKDNCNGNALEDGGDDGNLNIECKTCDRRVDCKMYNQCNSWPVSDDTERAKLLKKISSLIQALLRQKCLSVTHLHKVIHYTIEELQGLFPGSQILSCGVDQTPLCICFLGASSLKKIIDFLQNISYSCGFGRYPEKFSLDDTNACSQALVCEDRITLDESGSSLLLDESLLHFIVVKDDVGSVSPIESSGKGGHSDSDPLLSWIYAGPPSAEQLATWSRIRDEKSQEGIQLLDMLGKEFIQLQNLCDKKYELLGYEEALQGLEELCVEECKKREQVTDTSYCSYESILRKRRDELVEGDNEVVFGSNRLELEAISSVLKEAEGLYVSQYGYEDSYGGVASHLCDLEAGEDDWRSKDYVQRLNNCTEIIFQRQKEHMNTELNKLDAQIMRKLVNMNQLELKLEPVSILDYRFVLLPLVKSYMRAHLEDLAEKDAAEKSDAAREAFLAELALESKKSTGSGSDIGKSAQEKMKDKKRNKDLRRNKDTKLGSYTDQLEAADQSSLATNSDGDPVESDILESEIKDNIRELEAELQRKLELEAEERKLEETLEYQRRLENEAKQRLLAEHRSRNAPVASEDAGEKPYDVHVGISGASLCKQATLPSKNDSADSIDSSQTNLRHDACSRATDVESVGTGNSYIIPGLPYGPSDGVLPFEQQTGKRGRRRNSMKVPEEKNQTVSYGKENVKLENSTTVDIVQKDPSLIALNQSEGDGGSKTLRQLQVEEDEEERFQADLRKAVMQSLDSFQAHQKMPLVSNSGNARKRSQDIDTSGVKADGVTCDNVGEMDLVGPGLQNEVGEYNCFLNVIIQSLWHIRRFREEFLRRSESEHVHVGDPCVVCALYDILTALSIASENANREPVTPSTLRIALSNLYPDNNFFQEELSGENSFDEVLNLVEMSHQLACDPEAGGCGRQNHIHHILSNPPHVLTAVLGWQNTCENLDDIKLTLATLSTEIDISKLYRGLDPQNSHHLVSVVCYYGQHYHCFAYSHDHEKWVMYDDKTVKVIGTWEDVLSICERGHLQPQVLFYEAAN
ncbi:hypothetical protein KSS87_019418 [Heliosperma pusillum]|nr:hypothetical protein KSS87_019418 [Heliosperma pusillum]